MKKNIIVIGVLAIVLFAFAAPQEAFAANGREIDFDYVDETNTGLSVGRVVETTTGIRIYYSNMAGIDLGRINFNVIAIYSDTGDRNRPETGRSTRRDFEIISRNRKTGTLNLVFINSSRIARVVIDFTR